MPQCPILRELHIQIIRIFGTLRDGTLNMPVNPGPVASRWLSHRDDVIAPDREPRGDFKLAHTTIKTISHFTRLHCTQKPIVYHLSNPCRTIVCASNSDPLFRLFVSLDRFFPPSNLNFNRTECPQPLAVANANLMIEH